MKLERPYDLDNTDGLVLVCWYVSMSVEEPVGTLGADSIPFFLAGFPEVRIKVFNFHCNSCH